MSGSVKTKEQIEISQCNKQTSLEILSMQKHENLLCDFVKRVILQVNIAFLFNTPFY